MNEIFPCIYHKKSTIHLDQSTSPMHPMGVGDILKTLQKSIPPRAQKNHPTEARFLIEESESWPQFHGLLVFGGSSQLVQR